MVHTHVSKFAAVLAQHLEDIERLEKWLRSLYCQADDVYLRSILAAMIAKLRRTWVHARALLYMISDYSEILESLPGSAAVVLAIEAIGDVDHSVATHLVGATPESWQAVLALREKLHSSDIYNEAGKRAVIDAKSRFPELGPSACQSGGE